MGIRPQKYVSVSTVVNWSGGFLGKNNTKVKKFSLVWLIWQSCVQNQSWGVTFGVRKTKRWRFINGSTLHVAFRLLLVDCLCSQKPDLADLIHTIALWAAALTSAACIAAVAAVMMRRIPQSPPRMTHSGHESTKTQKHTLRMIQHLEEDDDAFVMDQNNQPGETRDEFLMTVRTIILPKVVNND